MIGLTVPVYINFKGFAEMVNAVDIEVRPFVVDNWVENRGVSGGWNAGIRKAIDGGVDTLIVIGDDVIPRPETLLKVLSGLDQYDLCTATHSTHGDEIHLGNWTESPDFSLFAIKPEEFIDKFGWFDEGFFPAYFEDNDMHRRIKLAGGAAMRNTLARYDSEISVTGKQVVSNDMFVRSQSYYVEKWGGLPGQEVFDSPFNERD